MKVLEEGLLNSKLRRTIARVIGKPGTLRFRLARDTVGVMVKRFAMTPVKGQKEGAVTMRNGLAEVYAQWPVLGLVTGSGGPLWGESRDTKNEDLSPKAVCRLPKRGGG